MFGELKRILREVERGKRLIEIVRDNNDKLFNTSQDWIGRKNYEGLEEIRGSLYAIKLQVEDLMEKYESDVRVSTPWG